MQSRMITAVVTIVCTFGCGDESKTPKTVEASADVLSGFVMDRLNLAVVEPKPTADDLSIDQLEALSLCQCDLDLLKQWHVEIASGQAHLPSVFFASVRQGVRENPDLRQLQELAGALGVALVPDATLLTSLSQELKRKLSEALGYPVHDELALHLDGFSSYFEKVATREISMQSSSAIWLAAIRGHTAGGLAAPGMDPVSTTNLLRTLLEWQYVFGLSEDGGEKPRGGLLVQPDDGSLGSYDPSQDEGGSGFVGGRYRVTWDAGNLATLATSGEETWSIVDETLDFGSQLRIGRAAAAAFSRLRPGNRLPGNALFGENRLLPDQAYLVPLAFLPGLQGLLREVYVDKEAQLIRSGPKEEAGIRDLASLVHLVIAWHTQLLSLSDVNLDATQMARLQDGLPAFKDLGRLAIRQIIDRHLVHASVGIDVQNRNGEQASRSDALEVLGSLASAADTLYPSDYLNEQVEGLVGQLLVRFAETDVTWQEIFLLASLADRKSFSPLRQAGRNLLHHDGDQP